MKEKSRKKTTGKIYNKHRKFFCENFSLTLRCFCNEIRWRASSSPQYFSHSLLRWALFPLILCLVHPKIWLSILSLSDGDLCISIVELFSARLFSLTSFIHCDLLISIKCRKLFFLLWTRVGWPHSRREIGSMSASSFAINVIWLLWLFLQRCLMMGRLSIHEIPVNNILFSFLLVVNEIKADNCLFSSFRFRTSNLRV